MNAKNKKAYPDEFGNTLKLNITGEWLLLFL